MTDLFASGDLPFTVADFVREAERELGMRRNVYPRRVATGAMSQRAADRQIELQVALIAFLKEAGRDAERYRWLRTRDLNTIAAGGVFAGMTPANVVLNEEHLDAAVDAGMKAEARRNGG